MRHRVYVAGYYLILRGMLPSCGFREECNLCLGFMLKEVSKCVDKRQHYLSGILTGNIILLEVGEAAEMESESVPLGCLAMEAGS